MPLSIFMDALPYTEVVNKYPDWLPHQQVAELIPNIAYSSSLHWQLYCDQYPDDRGKLVDWVNSPERKKSVKVLSTLLSPFDAFPTFSLYLRKMLDRLVYRRNEFANIPFRFRKDFTEQGKYLFWDQLTYVVEPIFHGYEVVSQDEGHLSFETFYHRSSEKIEAGIKNIFLTTGFADALGHKSARGAVYSAKLKPYMAQMQQLIFRYLKKNPKEEVLVLSDHGMSTVENHIDLQLEKKFGKQGKDSYIAYCDTAIMCIWLYEAGLKEKMSEYLSTIKEGHLLSDVEREYHRATDRLFGDLIFILREGNVFSDSWFGKSIRRAPKDGQGMHGFWPERSARDQMACIILANSQKKLEEFYDYRNAHELLCQVMQGRERL